MQGMHHLSLKDDTQEVRAQILNEYLNKGETRLIRCYVICICGIIVDDDDLLYILYIVFNIYIICCHL